MHHQRGTKTRLHEIRCTCERCRQRSPSEGGLFVNQRTFSLHQLQGPGQDQDQTRVVRDHIEHDAAADNVDDKRTLKLAPATVAAAAHSPMSGHDEFDPAAAHHNADHDDDRRSGHDWLHDRMHIHMPYQTDTRGAHIAFSGMC